VSKGSPDRVSLRDALPVWAKIGFLSFGGPAGQIALMHKELVEERRWIDEERFLHALNYCTLLPGPEAQQLATYIGWLMHRTIGGLVAGILFVLPGFVAMLALSVLYAELGDVPIVTALFFGLKAAVLAIVIEAVIRIGKRALKGRLHVAIAVSAFVAIFFFEVPFPLVVLGAALVGPLAQRFLRTAAHQGATRADGAATSVIDRMAERGELAHTRPSLARSARALFVCLVLWFGPIAALALLGPNRIFLDEALFFSQTAVVTFGGAYAVLAYIGQRAVESYGWLAPGEMLDGLGLAETTPGPLIMVVQFVGFLGAYRHPGDLPPLVAGTLGAGLTVWVTFVPCFLFIFVGAPYVEKLRQNRWLGAALAAITAAVVGVISNLSIWFGVHTLFGVVDERHFGPLRLLVPELATIDLAAVVLAAGAMVATLRFKVGVLPVLAACAALGILWKLTLGA
jgi:chromate transporter